MISPLLTASDWIRPSTWWRHQMETFSALLAIWRGIHRSPVNSPHRGQWRGVSFDMRPIKRLSNQSRGWRFETPSRPLWRHYNEVSTVSDPINNMRVVNKRDTNNYYIHIDFVYMVLEYPNIIQNTVYGICEWVGFAIRNRCFSIILMVSNCISNDLIIWSWNDSVL